MESQMRSKKNREYNSNWRWFEMRRRARTKCRKQSALTGASIPVHVTGVDQSIHCRLNHIISSVNEFPSRLWDPNGVDTTQPKISSFLELLPCNIQSDILCSSILMESYVKCMYLCTWNNSEALVLLGLWCQFCWNIKGNGTWTIF